MMRDLATTALAVMAVLAGFAVGWHGTDVIQPAHAAPAPTTSQVRMLQDQIDQNNLRTMKHHFEITALAGISDRVTDLEDDVDVCHKRLDDITKTLKLKLPVRKRPNR